MIIAVIVLLVVIIAALMFYNMSIHKKIQSFNNINQKITNLNILQDFMNALGECSSTDEKLEKINNILIERYEIKYSTIVTYNGAEYVVRASNVEEKHWETLSNLNSEEVFKESIETAVPKYITIDREGERLPYQKMEFGRAKSAMFFPLYIDNVYIGYWIIEGGRPHEFDNVDVTMLEVIKGNIVAVLKTIQTQETLQNIVRDDQFSKLKTAEYLYGDAKKIIDKYTTSTVCMFKIINLVEINNEFNRETGNNVITEVCNVISKNISDEYINEKMRFGHWKESLEIPKAGEEPDETEEFATPIINIVLSTYYKGTSLDGVTKKLEEYLDSTNPKENDINNL